MKIDQLILAVAPKADPRFVAAAVRCDAARIMAKWGLTDAASQALLLGQMAAESGGFRLFEENLNYRAETLTRLWPKRYPPGRAEQFAHSPRALAIDCYGSRMGNRPGTSDGWDCRGSNALQHTGRDEFGRVTKRAGIDVLSKPDRLRDASDGALTWNAACSFFVDRGALEPARAGQVEVVTRKVNGGLNGLADRKTYTTRAVRALAGQPLESGPAASLAPAGKPLEPTPPTSRTVDEEVDKTESDKKTARNAGTIGTISAGPASSMPQGKGSAGTLEHWVIVVSAVIVAGALALLIYRVFQRRHEDAVVTRETQQLAGLVQKVELSS